MRRHTHRLHYRLKWQQNFIQWKNNSFSHKMQYGIFTIVKTRFKATHCHAWSSQHKGKSLWSNENTAQTASFLNNHYLIFLLFGWSLTLCSIKWFIFWDWTLAQSLTADGMLWLHRSITSCSNMERKKSLIKKKIRVENPLVSRER